jgi:hypothetical protein
MRHSSRPTRTTKCIRVSSKLHVSCTPKDAPFHEKLFARQGFTNTLRNPMCFPMYHLKGPHNTDMEFHEKFWIRWLRTKKRILRERTVRLDIEVDWSNKMDLVYSFHPSLTLGCLARQQNVVLRYYFIPFH